MFNFIDREFVVQLTICSALYGLYLKSVSKVLFGRSSVTQLLLCIISAFIEDVLSLDW